MIREDGIFGPVMQCHSTPDTARKVCVGFAVVIGATSGRFRTASRRGLIEPFEGNPMEFHSSAAKLLRFHGEVQQMSPSDVP